MQIVNKDHLLPLLESLDHLLQTHLQQSVQVLDLFGVFNMVEPQNIALRCFKKSDLQIKLENILNKLKTNRIKKFFMDLDIVFSKVTIHVPSWLRI